jgi:hypothetical protein
MHSSLQAGLIAFLSAGAGALVARSEDELVTKRLAIVDDAGRERIVASAEPRPTLVFRSEDGHDLVRLGIGGEEGGFPFGIEGAPYLILEKGRTDMKLFVSPAPGKDMGPQFDTETANLFISTSTSESGKPETMKGKLFSLIVAPNRAVAGIGTIDPEDASSLFGPPGVLLFVDEQGNATTKLGPKDD